MQVPPAECLHELCKLPRARRQRRAEGQKWLASVLTCGCSFYVWPPHGVSWTCWCSLAARDTSKQMEGGCRLSNDVRPRIAPGPFCPSTADGLMLSRRLGLLGPFLDWARGQL